VISPVNNTVGPEEKMGEVRMSPPTSPRREGSYGQAALRDSAVGMTGLPPPPLPLSDEEHETKDTAANEPSVPGECPQTPVGQNSTHHQSHPNTPTPHAVPSPNHDVPERENLLEEWPRNSYRNIDTTDPYNNELTSKDPGPYASPFLAVIIDPRAAGPHTLVALRALHRLLKNGNIVQLCSDGDRYSFGGGGTVGGDYPFTTNLESIALGVLSCRFEQTDAGADEAVEMAIADLLGLIVEYDAMGAKSVESLVVKSAKEKKKRGSVNVGDGKPQGNRRIRIPRLPASVIMEAFHAVFVTRQTFVRGGIHGGHYSPALSNHFEQVLLKMIHYIFGGEDGHFSRSGVGGALSSRHVGAAKAILEFLIDQILSVTLHGNKEDVWMKDNPLGQQDGRALCLRLIQCCIKTGWGRGELSPAMLEEDGALLRLVEDDLCLALLTTGQAVWDEGHFRGAAPTTSPEVLSEVCSTLSLLWSLGHLRSRLHSQFVAIFSGFYQRALSLLRKRRLPEDGMAYQSNIIFDLEEVEVILESLVDILCLHGGPSSLSTLEELFQSYDCSLTELDVASGLLVELSLCCGGSVDEEGEAMPYSAPLSRSTSSGEQTPSKQSCVLRRCLEV
jgi:hypothetical protein